MSKPGQAGLLLSSLLFEIAKKLLLLLPVYRYALSALFNIGYRRIDARLERTKASSRAPDIIGHLIFGFVRSFSRDNYSRGSNRMMTNVFHARKDRASTDDVRTKR